MAEPSLELLQLMVQRVLDRLDTEFPALKTRLTALERAVLSLRSDMVGHAHVDANLQDQLDRANARLDRLERRLDIVG